MWTIEKGKEAKDFIEEALSGTNGLLTSEDIGEFLNSNRLSRRRPYRVPYKVTTVWDGMAGHDLPVNGSFSI